MKERKKTLFTIPSKMLFSFLGSTFAQHIYIVSTTQKKCFRICMYLYVGIFFKTFTQKRRRVMSLFIFIYYYYYYCYDKMVLCCFFLFFCSSHMCEHMYIYNFALWINNLNLECYRNLASGPDYYTVVLPSTASFLLKI